MCISIGCSPIDDIFHVVVKQKEIHRFVLFNLSSVDGKIGHDRFSTARLTTKHNHRGPYGGTLFAVPPSSTDDVLSPDSILSLEDRFEVLQFVKKMPDVAVCPGGPMLV